MMGQPLISIIMGVYNEEKTIRKCIDSIINQTYTNWEFIICNDHSTDKTSDILKEYSSRDGRIIILNNEKNLHLASSLNRCLEVTKGKYIARMDADDESLPDRLEKQVSYLEGHPDVDCVGCNRMIFDDSGDIGVRVSPENPTKNILKSNTPFAHPTIMMKKSVYDILGGYTVNKNTIRAQDVDLWIRFFEHDFKGYNIQEVLYRYHESLSDLKKRSLKAAIGTSKLYMRGYSVLKFPVITYLYALKPILSAIIPNSIMKLYHKNRLNRGH